MRHGYKAVDLSGKKFGRLTAIQRVGTLRGHALWKCFCSCGTTVNIPSQDLRSGSTRSCGCFATETASKLLTTHGMSDHFLYPRWVQMHHRCYDVKHVSYFRYGGVGVTVCDRWHDVVAFCEDMAGGYFEGASIDRIDNRKGYSLSNCRWATATQQASNRRSNVFYRLGGQRYTVKQLSEMCDVKYCTLRYRLKSGKSVEEAMQRC